MKKIILTSFAAVLMTGCASTFTSIEETASGDSYYLTRVSQGPFRVDGDMWECKPDAQHNMTCVEKGD